MSSIGGGSVDIKWNGPRSGSRNACERLYSLGDQGLHTNACNLTCGSLNAPSFYIDSIAFLLSEWIFRTTPASQTLALVILQITWLLIALKMSRSSY